MPSPIAVRQEIPVGSDAVWDLISSPGYLTECHPFCAANPVDRWPGAGSLDRIEYYNGRKVTRHFEAWHEGSGYDIVVSDANGPLADVVWRLSGAGMARSALTIAMTPRLFEDLPRPVRWVVDLVVIRPMQTRYLRSVVQGIEWRVTTGRAVEPNQFGPHPWFS